MFSSASQLLNALEFIYSVSGASVIFLSDVQFWKALLPIDVTLSPISTFTSEVQSPHIPFPISVISDGNLIAKSEVQP